MDDFVTVVEAGPRDGLQNEKQNLPVPTRIELIERLANCGTATVEAGSFVSPKRVPQKAGTEAVMKGLQRRPGARYPVLVRNLTGYEPAVAAGATEIAVFTAASEDVAYMLRGPGLETAVDLDELTGTGAWISKQMQRPNNSRAGHALNLSN